VLTRQKTTLFSGHYLRNRSTLDIGVFGYIGILYNKEHPPDVWHIPPGTPVYIYIYNSLVFKNILHTPWADIFLSLFISYLHGKLDLELEQANNLLCIR
jgi:hypothetical protein